MLDAPAVPNVDGNSPKRSLNEPEKSGYELKVEVKLTEEVGAQKVVSSTSSSFLL